MSEDAAAVPPMRRGLFALKIRPFGCLALGCALGISRVWFSLVALPRWFDAALPALLIGSVVLGVISWWRERGLPGIAAIVVSVVMSFGASGARQSQSVRPAQNHAGAEGQPTP